MQDKFDKICARFKEIEDSTDGQFNIANRVKMLIKNMFSNKESGWERTK